MKNAKISFSKSATVLLLALGAAAFILSCQTISFDPKDRSVPEAKRIGIPESGEQTGVYRTEDLTLTYKMTRQSGQLTVSGEIRFADRIANSFPVIQYFHLGVIMVDARGKVLSIAGLVSASFYQTQDAALPDYPLSFSIPITLTANTQAVAFHYTGKAIESGDDNGFENFWEYPIY